MAALKRMEICPTRRFTRLQTKGNKNLWQHYSNQFCPSTIFSIAAFFIDALDDPQSLLSQRLKILNSYLEGIEQQITVIKDDIPSIAKANIERTKYIVEAEIAGTESLIHAIL